MTSLNVLVIDDEPVVLDELDAVLKDMGHTTELAANAAEALSVLEQHAKALDIVLCDIRLPDKDGLTLLRDINALYPDLPVALMTGHADLDTAIEAIRSAAFDFLNKPFGYAEIGDLLRRLGEKVQVRHPLLSQHIANGNDQYELKLPSDLAAVAQCAKEWREYYRPVLEMAGINPYSAGLCLLEALNNAVIHGNLEVPSNIKDQPDGWAKFNAALEERQKQPEVGSRQVTMTWKVDSKGMQLTVADEGQGFDYDKVNALDETVALLEHGRGLLMIKKMMDRVVWQRKGATIEMYLSLESPKQSG